MKHILKYNQYKLNENSDLQLIDIEIKNKEDKKAEINLILAEEKKIASTGKSKFSSSIEALKRKNKENFSRTQKSLPIEEVYSILANLNIEGSDAQIAIDSWRAEEKIMKLEEEIKKIDIEIKNLKKSKLEKEKSLKESENYWEERDSKINSIQTEISNKEKELEVLDGEIEEMKEYFIYYFETKNKEYEEQIAKEYGTETPNSKQEIYNSLNTLSEENRKVRGITGRAIPTDDVVEVLSRSNYFPLAYNEKIGRIWKLEALVRENKDTISKIERGFHFDVGDDLLGLRDEYQELENKKMILNKEIRNLNQSLNKEDNGELFKSDERIDPNKTYPYL